MRLAQEVWRDMRGLLSIIVAHTAVLLILFVLLWVIIQVSHFLFPERPQIVFFLETASQLGFLLLFVIWTVVSVVSYAIAERKKVYVTEVQEISRR